MTFVLNADVITQPEAVYISVILSPAFVKVKYENPIGVTGVIVTGDAGVSTANTILISPTVILSGNDTLVLESLFTCATDAAEGPADNAVCDGVTISGVDDIAI